MDGIKSPTQHSVTGWPLVLMGYATAHRAPQIMQNGANYGDVTGHLYRRSNQTNYRGYAVNSNKGETISTIRELGDAAQAAGVLPSVILRRYELQRASLDPED